MLLPGPARTHADINDHKFGEKIALGTAFRRAVEEGLLDCERVVQIGCDLVEVSSPYDTTANTSLLSAGLLYEILCVLPGLTRR